MDWLDEQLQRLKNHPKKVAISLTCYLVLALLLVLGAWLITASICISWERMFLGDEVMLKLKDFFQWQPTNFPISDELAGTIDLLEGIRYYIVLIYGMIGIIGVSFFFSKVKIQQPILLIREGMEKIKANELDQQVYYQGHDEFELLVSDFDEMRRTLKEKQAEIQLLHEEQRKINAAFSHDLRTPLAVIQNNVELIEKFYPSGQMTEEMLQKSFGKIKNNVNRLSKFSETMKSIQHFDEIEVIRKRQSLERISATIQDLGKSLFPEKFSLKLEGDFNRKGNYDLQIIMEVTENLLSNAQRFAKDLVEVTLQLDEDYLFLFVKDDGPGFSKQELHEATAAYYSKEKENHFGLGLTIASTLTNKHGGVLKLANGAYNGAVVSAVFAIS